MFEIVNFNVFEDSFFETSAPDLSYSGVFEAGLEVILARIGVDFKLCWSLLFGV